MKTRVTSLLVLLAALGAPALAPLSAAPAETSADGFTIEKVARGDAAEITRGVTPMTVLRLMSSPQRKLTPDVWVYQNHHVASAAADARGCDTLVLTFVDGKLSELKIVNARAVAVIAANLKQPSATVLVAQK